MLGLFSILRKVVAISSSPGRGFSTKTIESVHGQEF